MLPTSPAMQLSVEYASLIAAWTPICLQDACPSTCNLEWDDRLSCRNTHILSARYSICCVCCNNHNLSKGQSCYKIYSKRGPFKKSHKCFTFWCNAWILILSQALKLFRWSFCVSVYCIRCIVQWACWDYKAASYHKTESLIHSLFSSTVISVFVTSLINVASLEFRSRVLEIWVQEDVFDWVGGALNPICQHFCEQDMTI